MSESNELNVDSLRNPSELPHHWKLRREFLSVYKNKFDADRLVSLSHLFVNIKCLGLTYPQEVMDKVDKLGKSIDTKLIEEATVEESYESRVSETSSDDTRQQRHYQQSQRYNNHNRNDNNWRNQTSGNGGGGGGGRPYSRPRYQQSHHDNRHQPHHQQQQQQQSYMHQEPQGYQQQQQPPQQFARYNEQPQFFRPQELRPRSDRQQGSGQTRQPFYRPRQRGGNHRGNSDGYNRRTHQQ